MKELTERLGITPRTLRFWEEHGLIGPGRRGNVRVYNPEEVSRIAHIVKLRRAGLSIDEVKSVLYRSRYGRPTDKDIVDRLVQLRKTALEQVALIDELLGQSTGPTVRS